MNPNADKTIKLLYTSIFISIFFFIYASHGNVSESELVNQNEKTSLVLNPWVVALLGAIGSVLSEILKQRNKWRVLTEQDFKAQFKSLKFWSLVVVLITIGIVSSLAIYFDSQKSISFYTCIAAGASSTALFRMSASSALPKPDVQAMNSSKVTLKKLLE